MKHLKTLAITIAVLSIILPAMGFAQEDSETFTVGIVTVAAVLQEVADGFMEGMTELGYEEGENVTYLYDGPLEELEDEERIEAVQALIDAEVDVIFASGSDEVVLVQSLTDEIPIIFGLASDPIGAGLVESFNEPGGNATGIEIFGYHDRRLQLLVEIDLSIERVYYPYNPERPGAEEVFESLQETAEELEIELVAVEITDIESAVEATENIPDDINAIFLSTEGLVFAPPVMPGWFAASMQLQAGISIPAYVPIPGILMGYGPDVVASGQQAARLVDRILHGADPADLPVESAEYFLLIDLGTATAFDIEISRGILRQADTIVRPGD